MPSESELRPHRCCFLGHRPEKLDQSPEEVRAWLEEQIDSAIADGYTTFISGCAMGVDIWAGQIVLRKKATHPALRLIAATPWPGFAGRWNDEWRRQYNGLLKNADLVINVCDHYHDDVFRQRNEWMVNHSSRVIAFWNGTPGGTKDAMDYAKKQGVRVVASLPGGENRLKREHKAEATPPRRLPFPDNLLTETGLSAIFGEAKYTELSPDQRKGLAYSIGLLPRKERALLEYRYGERRTLQECGERFGFSRQRAHQISERALRTLRSPARAAFIRDGYEKAELALRIKCAEQMKKILCAQQKRRPLMNEEDVVKLVFQGMLGVGHLIPSEEQALEQLRAEMSGLAPDADEPLTEKVSPQWFRLNLRAAKAKGLAEADIACMFCRSAGREPLAFTRQNVYNFCVKLDGSDRMKAAAEKVLDGSRLPAHSEQYREAYRPAYRVLHFDFRKLRREEDED